MALVEPQHNPLAANRPDSSACSACRLPASHCVCVLRPQFQIQAGLCLLYHAKEPARSSNTGHLVEECIAPCYSFIWSRTQQPAELQALLAAGHWAPYLVFPREYAAPGQPVTECIQPLAAGCRPLLVILDATWNQARKILRQSPWLQALPCLSLAPQQASRYRLRRSQRGDHLCTAEVAELCLGQLGESAAARGLGCYLDQYSDAWLAARDHRPSPFADQ